jgi:hypothetical protein
VPNTRLQATLTREFFASEAPASQLKLLIEQIRAVLLREGRLTNAHRLGGGLSRQPLGWFQWQSA